MTVFFRDLIVWQKSIDLVEAIYRVSQHFPSHENYGLTQQIRRASISISSNIAEGSERETTRDFLRFLSMSRGSQAEVETQLVIALRLGYITEEQYQNLLLPLHEIGRLLNGLQRSLNAKLENA